MEDAAKDVAVDLSLWEEDFIFLTNKLIDFNKACRKTNTFYFDSSLWIRQFNSVIDSECPLEPLNLFGMVFYALEFVVSKEISDKVRDASADAMKEELKKILDVVFAKNKDYGNSALQNPVLIPWLGRKMALLVRLSDKVHRVRNLLNSNKEATYEPLQDSLRDVVGYVFLLWALIRTENQADAD